MVRIDEGKLVATQPIRPTGDIGRSKRRTNIGFNPAEVG